jgi:hypothetical protein
MEKESSRLTYLCRKSWMGATDQKQTEQILDYFYEQGGNFIDTSNNYQDEESETWIGEWLQKRGNRDQMGMHIVSLELHDSPRTDCLCESLQPNTPPISELGAGRRTTFTPITRAMAPRACMSQSMLA